MKNLTIVAVFFLVISGFASSASAQGRHHDRELERFGHEFANAFVDHLVFGERHHHRRQYREYPPQYRGYSEIDQARMEGYQQARQRDLEERRWRAENARRQALENARQQGELEYQSRHNRRW